MTVERVRIYGVPRAVKIEHVVVNGVVHRLVTADSGAQTISCLLENYDEDFSLENEMTYTDHHLTCVECIVWDWRAASLKARWHRKGNQLAPSRKDNP